MKDTVRQLAVLISVIVTIAINSLANALPFNGQTTGEISDRFPVYFVPAGYVFSIWGLIYIGLLVYAIYQLLPAQRENPRLQSTGWWVVLSNVANAVWIFLWHYEFFVLTLVAMLVLLGSLITIYLRLRSGRDTAISKSERSLARLPFSIYLGWITVATIANVTALLSFLNWDGWGIDPQVWTVLMLAAAVLIAGIMAWTRRDTAYLLVLVWAFIGIAVKHAGVALVAGGAWAAVGIVALFAVFTLAKRLKVFSLVSQTSG